jgi:hypothetical protein
MELDQTAIEAEADRLFGVLLRIRLLAQARCIDFQKAGEEAVRVGLVTQADWRIVQRV